MHDFYAKGIRAERFALLLEIGRVLAESEGKPFALVTLANTDGVLLSKEGLAKASYATVYGWVHVDGMYSSADMGEPA